ncbi:MAG: putative Fe-S cluster assembly protein SufT [Verrucomicrobiota bacterium]
METQLLRDVSVTAIPSGAVTQLPSGTSVAVVQTLGGNVTVRAASGLFRIARADADALDGLDLAQLDAAVAADDRPAAGEFGEDAVWAALKTCFDPEIPVNIVDLGLIYDLSIEKTPAGGHTVEVKMTLTAPGCGMGPVIAEDARSKIAALPAVESAKVHVVWDPVWSPTMISEEGRLKLGIE